MPRYKPFPDHLPRARQASFHCMNYLLCKHKVADYAKWRRVFNAGAAEMRKAGLPANVSNTAGTFVCNHILYSLMDIIATHPTKMRGGFLHIPYVPEQAARLGGAPSMAVDDIVRGIEIIVATSADRTMDIHTAEGRIS